MSDSGSTELTRSCFNTGRNPWGGDSDCWLNSYLRETYSFVLPSKLGVDIRLRAIATIVSLDWHSVSGRGSTELTRSDLNIGRNSSATDSDYYLNSYRRQTLSALPWNIMVEIRLRTIATITSMDWHSVSDRGSTELTRSDFNTGRNPWGGDCDYWLNSDHRQMYSFRPTVVLGTTLNCIHTHCILAVFWRWCMASPISIYSIFIDIDKRLTDIGNSFIDIDKSNYRYR